MKIKAVLILVVGLLVTTARPIGTMEKVLYFCGGTGGGFVAGVGVTGFAGLVFAYVAAEIHDQQETKITALKLRLAETETTLDNTELLLRSKSGRKLLTNYYKEENEVRKGLTELLEEEEFSTKTPKLRTRYAQMLAARHAGDNDSD